MKTSEITFEQWLNRFFDRTDFCRDVLSIKAIATILSDCFKSQASIEVAAEAIRCAVWREEI